MAKELLSIEGLVKRFDAGSINQRVALDGVSISAAAGDFITIIGSNGSGKSTLMNAIAGIVQCDEGRIYIDGKDVTSLKDYKRAKMIGRVFQDPLRGTAVDMSIEENLAIACAKGKRRGLQRGITAKQREDFKGMLAELGLGIEDRMKVKVRYLSGGQRQALTLLMATLVKPKVLLLDEHTAALDPGIARTVLELTDRCAGDDLCTLMITHNMKAALEHGNRTILMRQGKIMLDIAGQTRESYTVDQIVKEFDIDNDRMLI